MCASPSFPRVAAVCVLYFVPSSVSLSFSLSLGSQFVIGVDGEKRDVSRICRQEGELHSTHSVHSLHRPRVAEEFGHHINFTSQVAMTDVNFY